MAICFFDFQISNKINVNIHIDGEEMGSLHQ